ncbi:MAG TPA: FtsX-like permease family protein [Thermoanaerobaculia bacterium]
MTKFIRIAARNVFRNPRRTAFTLFVIVFGAVAMILAGGFVAFNFQGLREMTIRNGVGHLQIFTQKYIDGREERPLELGIENPGAVQTWLQKQPHVVATSPEIEFVGLISNGEKSETFLGRGIDPSRQEAMGFNVNIKGGRPLTTGENEIILGTGLAKIFDAKIGDSLTLLGTTSNGALNAIDVQVVGFFSTGIKEFDQRAVKVSIPTAQTLIDTTRVTKLIVKLDDTTNTAAVSAAVRKGLPQHLGIRTWRDMAGFYKQVVMLYSGIFLFLGIIIVILVVLSSSNTMMMTVFERVQEIGTLMALGTRRRHIIAIFLIEGLMIGILGGLLGWVAGYGATELINAAGITMPPPPSFEKGISLKVHFVPELYAGVFALIASTLVFAAIIPAVRAARLRIVDALRHV